MLTRRRCCCGGGGCGVTVCVRDCSGNPIVGATVTVTLTSSTVSGTTTGGGCVTLDIGAVGTHATTITASGYYSFDGDIAYGTCGDTTTITLAQVAPYTYPCLIAVQGCGGSAVEGATVSINGATLTTDSSGFAYFTAPAIGSYPFTVSAHAYSSGGGTVVVTDGCPELCGETVVNLTLLSGYVCCDLYACEPLPHTLNVTDSQYGTTTVAYNPVSDQWEGTLAVSFGGGCGCPAQSVTLTYIFNCSNSIGGGAHVQMGIAPGGGTGCPGNAGGLLSPSYSGVVSACAPLVWTSNYAGCLCSGGACTGNSGAFVWRIYPGVSTITVTE